MTSRLWVYSVRTMLVLESTRVGNMDKREIRAKIEHYIGKPPYTPADFIALRIACRTDNELTNDILVDWVYSNYHTVELYDGRTNIIPLTPAFEAALESMYDDIDEIDVIRGAMHIADDIKRTREG